MYFASILEMESMFYYILYNLRVETLALFPAKSESITSLFWKTLDNQYPFKLKVWKFFLSESNYQRK